MNAEQEQNLLQNLTEKSNHLIDWLDSAAKGTGNFLSEQPPMVISEYLTYNFWMSLATFILCGLIFLVMVITGGVILKKKPFFTVDYRGGRDYFPTHMTGAAILSLSIIPFGSSCNTLDWFKIKVAPRVYVIEKAAELVKQIKQ